MWLFYGLSDYMYSSAGEWSLVPLAVNGSCRRELCKMSLGEIRPHLKLGVAKREKHFWRSLIIISIDRVLASLQDDILKKRNVNLQCSCSVSEKDPFREKER